MSKNVKGSNLQHACCKRDKNRTRLSVPEERRAGWKEWNSKLDVTKSNGEATG